MDSIGIETLYRRFNEESVSHEQITRWLNQFDAEDRPTALFLAERIDYWGYRRVHLGLHSLHHHLMERLLKDGYIDDTGPEHCYDRIDFSRSFCSKSGDLISYFYRKMNTMRSMEFVNLEGLEHRDTDLSDRALIILDDYIGTGCQFLSFSYRNEHADLFNRYGKIYVATLVANNQAIKTFQEVNAGNFDTLVRILSGVEEIDDPVEIENLRASFSSIRPGQSRLVYAKREMSLLDPESSLDEAQRTGLQGLFEKYAPNYYCHGLFNLASNTVFFFQCPNDAPQILWDWDCGNAPGQWYPLFPRVSDSSIYEHDGNIPFLQQVSGKLWDD